jgi:hypothetical protein
MALIGNHTVLNKSPLRFINLREGLLRSNFNKHGMMRNAYEQFNDRCATPNGHLSPSAWVLPKTAGGGSSRNYVGLTIAPTATGAMGVNAVGALTMTFDLLGTGGLVVSGAGTSAFTITGTVTGSAGLFADGTSSFVFGAGATVSALNYAIGTASFTITGTLEPYGIGYMYGSTVDDSIVTNDTIASAVWSKVIEAGYTSEQILRLLAAHAAGAATGLEGADMQFVGLDGVTTRIDGTYSAGTRTIDALDAE